MQIEFVTRRINELTAQQTANKKKTKENQELKKTQSTSIHVDWYRYQSTFYWQTLKPNFKNERKKPQQQNKKKRNSSQNTHRFFILFKMLINL